MSIKQQKISKVLSILSHPLRREIMLDLHQKGECSFTDLMRSHNIDTGKLSFHIRSLMPFIEQTETGKYKLNDTGVNAIKFLRDLEFWTEETEMVKNDSKLPLASFKQRFFAFTIDFVLMFTIILGITFGSNFSNTFFVTLFLLWGYSTLLEGFKEQTLGKKILGLKVVRVDGKKISYDQAGVRNFGKVFLLPFDLLFGRSIRDDVFIRYFDKFAGTTVIDMWI